MFGASCLAPLGHAAVARQRVRPRCRSLRVVMASVGVSQVDPRQTAASFEKWLTENGLPAQKARRMPPRDALQGRGYRVQSPV